MSPIISKSKYVTGLQCHKLLWTHYNDKALIPSPDAATLAIFEAGHAVGDLAKQLYPDGVEVGGFPDLDKTCAETRALLPRRVPIFEASFLDGGCYCRADILVPVADDAWDLYEVKSSTRVKDVNVQDVSFQTDLIERSGLKLNRLYLMHIDNTYVRSGEIDVRGLFHATDITDLARALQPRVLGDVDQMQSVIAGPQPPVPIGPHCSSPYDCDLWPLCSAHLPPHNALDLYGIHKSTAFNWIDSGRLAIIDIPTVDLSFKQKIQQAAVREARPQIDHKRIRAWFKQLQYPLYCFDFETVAVAVPLLDGTRPYQAIPFQFSLHVLPHPGAEPEHIEYLAETATDPRPALIQAMRAIGSHGDILAYSKSYEIRMIREMAEAFPTEALFLMDLIDRFRDLKDPFSSFWYHDARQHGSCSLKHVLPALTDTTYDGLEIADGGQATREFARVVFGDVEPRDKAQTLQALRDYCRQDTQALVDILGVLLNLT